MIPAYRVKNDLDLVFVALLHCLAHLLLDLRLLDIHLVHGLDMPLDPLHQLVFTLGFLLEFACQAEVLAPERFHLFHRLHRPVAYAGNNIKLLMISCASEFPPGFRGDHKGAADPQVWFCPVNFNTLPADRVADI